MTVDRDQTRQPCTHQWRFIKTVWAYDDGTHDNPQPHSLFFCTFCLDQTTRREKLPTGGIQSKRSRL